MRYHGDFRTGKTIRFIFNTRDTTGAPITLAGTPAVSVYKDGGTTESTAGVTLTTDFDSRTGAHLLAIDTSADGTFYSSGSDFHAMITTGTVNSISVVGQIVGVFSLENRSPLMPTTAGRTLDVSSGGEAGLDWANVGSPTTAVGLSGTTIATSQVVASVTGAVGSVTGNVGGSVASVTAGVTVTTNNDKTGYALVSTGLAAVTAWTVAITGNITGNVSGSVGSVTAVVSADVTKWNGTTVATPDTAGYPKVTIKNGTGTGEVSFSAGGVAKADLTQILTYTLSQSSSAALTSAFQHFFDVTAPTGTVNSIPNAVAGAAGGLLIAGSNAATSFATFTANITGNLSGSVGSVSGSVGSVTGAVASVTGNVGGNVVGSVGSVVGAVGSVTGNVGGNVVGTVASVVGNIGGNVVGSVGSVSGLNAAFLDVAVSSRLAGGSYTAPPTAADIWTYGTRDLTGGVSVTTNYDKGGYSLAVAPPSAADIWTYGTRTLTSGGSGGASAADIAAALAPTIKAGSFTNSDRETLGKALTMEQFVALQNP